MNHETVNTMIAVGFSNAGRAAFTALEDFSRAKHGVFMMVLYISERRLG